jgi:hypothetical protein
MRGIFCFPGFLANKYNELYLLEWKMLDGKHGWNGFLEV